MPTTSNFEFMGLLHFEAILKGENFQFSVYDKSGIKYESTKNDNNYGSLMGSFEVPQSMIGNLQQACIVENMLNQMFIMNLSDKSLDPIEIPVHLNKKTNKYEFITGTQRVFAKAKAGISLITKIKAARSNEK